MALTDAWLKANLHKNHTKVHEHADRDGLSVRISPKGKITFQIRYRYQGYAKRLDLGSYPLMTLKEARLENLNLRAGLQKGQDPKLVQQLAKHNYTTRSDLHGLFTKWYTDDCKQRKKSHIEIKRSFEIHFLPELGNLPAEEISLSLWMHHLEKVAHNTPAIAERLLDNAKQMLKWGVRREMMTQNPLQFISARRDLHIDKKTVTRVLCRDELAKIWTAILHSRLSIKNKIFMQLCLIYGCRNGELRLSKKEHFNLKTGVWIVPPENHKIGQKTRKPLLRPILPEIKPWLETAFLLAGGSPFLFNNVSSNAQYAPMGRSSSTSIPYRLRDWLKKNHNYDMTHWSLHDLRRTARTHFSTLTEPHIAEIMLGHKLPGHWQTYDQYDYLPEQMQLLQKWWQKLMKIVQQPLQDDDSLELPSDTHHPLPRGYGS